MAPYRIAIRRHLRIWGQISNFVTLIALNKSIMTQDYNLSSVPPPFPPTEDRNTFQGSIKYCLSNYANFQGRASRAEYWYFYLFTLIIGIATGIMGGILDSITDSEVASIILQGLGILAILIPSLAVGARRLHDTGRSAAYLFLALIPIIGSIALLIFFVQEGELKENQYGPNPYGKNLFG